MATSALPGSYPDSIPPTPDETMMQQQQKQPSQLDQQRRQSSNLHKPSDPRGHKHTDSGVAIPESGPIRSSHHDDKSHWYGPNEAIGGGTYVRGHHTTLFTGPMKSPIGIELGTTTKPTAARETKNSAVSSKDENRTSTAAMIGTSAVEGGAGKTEPKALQQQQQQQQQSLEPSRPLSDEPASHLGDADGAVYNTVTGHGSAADDHEEHHHLPPKSAPNSSSPGTAVVEGDVTNYPRGTGVYNTVTGHGSQDDDLRRRSRAIAPGFLPETAVRDDVLHLAEANSRDGGHVDAQAKRETAPQQRAFPLATGPSEGRNDGRASESPSRQGAAAAAAAAAAVADRNQEGVGALTNGKGERSQAVAAGGAAKGNERRSSQPTSPIEKASSHEEGWHKGNNRNRKHGIFGIFHRRKSDAKEVTRRKSAGDQDEPANQDATVVGNPPSRPRKPSRGESTTERRRSRSSAKTEDETSAGGAAAAAAGTAAAGAGAFGLFHRAKRKSTGEETQEKTQDAANSNRAPMSAGAGGAGPAGGTMHQTEEVPTPFEHPREPPVRPEGVGHGLAAAGAENQSGATQGTQQKKAGATTTNEPGGNYYNTLASGTPSGLKKQARGTTSRHEEYDGDGGDGGDEDDNRLEYNVLSSGTPSGVKVKPKSRRRSAHADTATATTGTDGGGLPAADNDTNTSCTAAVVGRVGYGSAAAAGAPTIPSTRTQQQQNQHELLPPIPPSSHGPERDGERAAGARHAPAPGISNASQESLPGVTTYGPRAAEHDMSPEVMPAAYYVASSSSSRSALAPAGATRDRGGRVMHVCRHCGLENDITEYLQRAGRAGDGPVSH
ncbi:hypothetical protein MYCTH_2305838 [Thermothelomyces thermophilus ATCC 42464]|uniref:Uncharacterized protein n=1 Tax=Thermothelomyces thermophilus (strain ATCC 42464 / BCRC 31852 / DSM 1799) TaxID=573729 RepID=G2QG15_THET4|nr:uncharacterized protein MYCTH_2305838 [Thermothelomyces thermophilus ATCC 42464]AEO58480.1 hypothetical protein MYCTH_2305838 [Thermothelomyces thermophilus ATCC 42464]